MRLFIILPGIAFTKLNDVLAAQFTVNSAAGKAKQKDLIKINKVYNSISVELDYVATKGKLNDSQVYK